MSERNKFGEMQTKQNYTTLHVVVALWTVNIKAS